MNDETIKLILRVIFWGTIMLVTFLYSIGLALILVTLLTVNGILNKIKFFQIMSQLLEHYEQDETK